MQDRDIELDEPSTLEAATAHHWQEIMKHGETTFHSDIEDRTISKDAIMREVLDELDDKGLYELIMLNYVSVSIKACKASEDKLNAAMEEALNDYYM